MRRAFSFIFGPISLNKNISFCNGLFFWRIARYSVWSFRSPFFPRDNSILVALHLVAFWILEIANRVYTHCKPELAVDSVGCRAGVFAGWVRAGVAFFFYAVGVFARVRVE